MASVGCMSTVFVGRVSRAVTRNELMRLFETCGAVGDVRFGKPLDSQLTYAFVSYFKKEDAEAAIRTYDGFILGEFRIYVEMCKIPLQHGRRSKGQSKSLTTPCGDENNNEPCPKLPGQRKRRKRSGRERGRRRRGGKGSGQRQQTTRANDPLHKGAPKKEEGADTRLKTLKQQAFRTLGNVTDVQILLHRLDGRRLESDPPYRETCPTATVMRNLDRLEICAQMVADMQL